MTHKRTRTTKAHFVGVNCHPFHELADICAGLPAIAEATEKLRHSTGAPVITRLFWNGREELPTELTRACKKAGIPIETGPHDGNGMNLNRQLMQAERLGCDYFYRVDGDDVVFPQRFCWQAERLQQGDCDICGGGLRYESTTGAAYDVLPTQRPQSRDYLENRFVLHPSMAFRVAAFRAGRLLYWPHRLEDKALLAEADAAGLRIANLQGILGIYRVSPDTRRAFMPKWLNLRLNLLFLHRRSAWHWIPYACVLFCAHLVVGTHLMRSARQYFT